MRQRTVLLATLMIAPMLAWGCSKSGSKGEEAEERIPVEVARVSLGDLPLTLKYSGDIEAEFEVKVFSKVPDRIERFFVDEGDIVKKGDPVARIAATAIEQAVRQTEAGLVAAKAQEANMRLEYERAQRLSKENAMSAQQYDAIQTQYEAAGAQLEQAEAALTTAKSSLDDATVSAPIAGIIGERNYEAGDMATGMEPIVTVVQMDRVKVTFDATEVDLGELTLGQRAVARVKSYPGQEFSGKVTKISPVLDPETRMAKVEVTIENPGHRLKPGMYASVEVTTRTIRDQIVIPRRITIEHTKAERIEGKDSIVREYYVFIVNGDKAEQRKLGVRYLNHESIAVSSGLAVGESLVTVGQNNLKDGALVSIIARGGDAS